MRRPTTKRAGLWLGAAALVLVVAVGAWALSRRGARPLRDSMAGMEMKGESMPGRAGMEMGDEGAIGLTADQVRTFGITFGTAEVRPLEKTIRVVGLVDYDETRMAYVAPKFGGYVERLYVDFTGQPVSRGQPLLEIESDYLKIEVDRAEASLARAKAAEAEARRDFERKEGLVAKGSVSQAVYDRTRATLDQAEATRADTSFVASPGVALSRNAGSGRSTTSRRSKRSSRGPEKRRA